MHCPRPLFEVYNTLRIGGHGNLGKHEMDAGAKVAINDEIISSFDAAVMSALFDTKYQGNG